LQVSQNRRARSWAQSLFGIKQTYASGCSTAAGVVNWLERDAFHLSLQWAKSVEALAFCERDGCFHKSCASGGWRAGTL